MVEAKQKRVSRRILLIISIATVLTIALAVVGWLLLIHHGSKKVSQTPAGIEFKLNSREADWVPQNFTADEFKNLYNSFGYPNTTQISSPPPITGNVAADEKIRTLAEARGYKLRSLANMPLETVDGFFLQSRAVASWTNLKSSAAAAGVKLGIIAGYRSVEDQRTLFLGRLAEKNIKTSDIAAGTVDTAVDQVLHTTAAPGYSRHHTGYTIDMECNGGTVKFENSVCDNWLSANNYEAPKRLGWIPSYPKGANLQGPEPEPWEYIWLGLAALTQK